MLKVIPINKNVSSRKEISEAVSEFDGLGCVYVIKFSEHLYKIGKTINAVSRLASIRTTEHADFDIIYIITTDKPQELEAHVQRMVIEKRVRGCDFFDLSEDDVLRINTIPEDQVLEQRGVILYQSTHRDRYSDKPILFKPYVEDEPKLAALRKSRPGVSDSQLIRELVHQALGGKS